MRYGVRSISGSVSQRCLVAVAMTVMQYALKALKLCRGGWAARPAELPALPGPLPDAAPRSITAFWVEHL